MVIKKSLGEHVFDNFNYIFLGFITFLCLYPMLYVLFASISEPTKLIQHSGLLLKPIGFTTAGYKVVLGNPNIYSGYKNTLIYVIGGTSISIFMSSLGAYALSCSDFMFKKPMMMMIVITMYFGGGLIPNFLLIQGLGLLNTRWAILVPGAIGTWNMIVMKTSFAAIPHSLRESARIDGANDFTVLFKIIMPVAKATLAVQILFYSVGNWNAWFGAMIYLRNKALWPLQLFLREILIGNSASGNVVESFDDVASGFVDVIIKYCTIIISTLPVLAVYPFCQKYFVKGIMVGSLKG